MEKLKYESPEIEIIKIISLQNMMASLSISNEEGIFSEDYSDMFND